LVVRNARLVSPRGVFRGGVAAHNGVIVAVAGDLHLPRGDLEVDARGRFLLPWVLDGHAHTFLPPETPATGTRAAAKGGVTTLLEMPGTQFGCFTGEEFRRKRREMERVSHVDFCIHAGCASGHPGELEAMHSLGATGAKFFLSSAGPKWPQTFDGEVLDRFRELASFNGLALVHAENDHILRYNSERLRGAGRVDYGAHLEWRPKIAEVEAGRRVLEFLGVTGCRGLLVHTSAPELVWSCAEARMRGVEAYVETCPQYLYLTDEDVKEKGPWCKFAPPPRGKEERAEMRRLLQGGWVETVATDHAPYGRERKEAGVENIWDAPNGIPGLETHLPLLLNGVAEGWLTLERLVQVASENPAKLYGVFPRKGALMVGSDADMVLVDMGVEREIRDEDQVSACGWTPYHGMRVQGWPVMSIIRGEVVMEDDQVVVGEGFGEFIPRGQP